MGARKIRIGVMMALSKSDRKKNAKTMKSWPAMGHVVSLMMVYHYEVWVRKMNYIVGSRRKQMHSLSGIDA